MNLQIRLSFEDIFPHEEKYSVDYYLQGIEKKNLKKLIIQLIHASYPNSTWQDWNTLLFKKWFSNSNAEYARMLYKKILELEHVYQKNSRKQRYILLNLQATLILAEYIITKINEKEETVLDEEITEQNIFKALLVINSDLNEADERATNSEKFEGHVSMPVGISMTYGLAQDELVNFGKYKLFFILTTQIIKALYLFDFLKINKPNLLTAFLSKFEREDFADYIKSFAPVVIHSLSNHFPENDIYEPNPLIITFSETEKDSREKKFIEKFIISADLINEDLDYKNLRAFPIIEYDKNEYAIISDLFAIQKIYNGLYFELKEINENMDQGNEPEFRQYFTFNFAEKNLLYKTMENIYGKRSYIRYSGQEIEDEFNFRGGPDYYIRNGNTIFLVENKDVFISSSAKVSYDFDIIRKELNKKLVDKKGLPQVIKNIKYILDKSYPFDVRYNIDNIDIYPIIITHRNEFDCPGINIYLKDIFMDMLLMISEKGYDVSNVKPLTLINIDTLLLFQNSLKDRKIMLHDAILSYHRFVNREIRARTRDEYDEKHAQTLNSFSDFIINYVNFKKIHIKDEVDFWVRKYFKEKIFFDL